MAHTQSAAPTNDASAPPASLPSAIESESDRAVPASPPFSLLRLSAFERLLGASVVVACLWAGVYWALH